MTKQPDLNALEIDHLIECLKFAHGSNDFKLKIEVSPFLKLKDLEKKLFNWCWEKITEE